MAEFLHAHSGLYDKAKDMWRDRQARIRLFHEQVSTIPGRTGAQLQQWYEGIRNKLGRLKKRAMKSGSGSGVITDAHKRLMDQFLFMLVHIGEVKRRKTSRGKETEQTGDEDN